jgi:hypothetical protein
VDFLLSYVYYTLSTTNIVGMMGCDLQFHPIV